LKRAELADLLFAEPAERPAIEAAADEILRRQSELEREVIEHILEEKALLSPSQRMKFYQIIVDQFSAGGLGVHDIKGRKSLSPPTS
jgi:Spy/CpxP family protein refolding chaperone